MGNQAQSPQGEGWTQAEKRLTADLGLGRDVGRVGSWGLETPEGAGATKMLGPIAQLCFRSACTEAEAKPGSNVTGRLLHLRSFISVVMIMLSYTSPDDAISAIIVVGEGAAHFDTPKDSGKARLSPSLDLASCNTPTLSVPCLYPVPPSLWPPYPGHSLESRPWHHPP